MSSQLYPKNLGTRFAQHLENLFPRNEVEIVARGSEYSQYQDDPVGFGEKILGETYTDEVKIMMESVRDNPMVALGYAVLYPCYI